MSRTNGNIIRCLVGALAGAAMTIMVGLQDQFLVLQSTLTSNSDNLPVARSHLRSTQISQKILTDPYYTQMMDNDHLKKSLLQHESFLKKKDYLKVVFPRESRFDADQGGYGASVLSDRWAFLHIWGNGGRTVVQAAENQLEEFQHEIEHSQIRRRKWMALVQDPILHFLEGWALTEIKLVEDSKGSGHEDLVDKIIASWENEHLSYDERVSQFLIRVERFARKYATAKLSPLLHALPQTNFMLDDVGLIHSNLAMIGDISEWRAMMELTNFPGDVEKAIPDEMETLQAKYFPKDPSLLSEETLLKLCDFLAMDYFLLRYSPPAVCTRPGGPLDFRTRRALSVLE